MTSAQLSEWEAYDTLDPVGKWRDDFHAAFIISEVSNIAQDLYGKEGVKRFTPSDFMPKWNKEDAKKGLKKESKKQSVGEMRQFMQMVADTQNKSLRKVRTTPPHKKIKK